MKYSCKEDRKEIELRLGFGFGPPIS